MRKRLLVFIVPILSVFIFSCKKEKADQGTCAPGVNPIREIVDQNMTVYLSGEDVGLYEDGSIDAVYIPCDFPSEFRIDKLQVKVSGEVKAIVLPDIYPGGWEGLRITKIEKR